MAKVCKTCGGKGRWQEREVVDGNVIITQKVCGTCHGRGKILDPDELGESDYDIDGDSFQDEDDDDA